MKAYLTTIGEPTTNIARFQLDKLGFEVILMDVKEPWIQKYTRFIEQANENCLRVDADVVVNRHILDCLRLGDDVMAQFSCYDFYRNDIHASWPIYYGKNILNILKQNIEKLEIARPEASAWRLPEIQPHTVTFEGCYGSHGIGADKDMIDRAIDNKIKRGQMDEYDFALAGMYVR